MRNPANPIPMEELSKQNIAPDVGSVVSSSGILNRQFNLEIRKKSLRAFTIRISRRMKTRIDQIALFENMRPAVQARRMVMNGIRKYEKMPQFRTFLAGAEVG